MALHSIPVTTGKQKLHPETGIEGLGVELQRGQWIIPSVNGKSHPEIEKFCGEMLWYDPSKHTGDRLMAAWLVREGIRVSTLPKPKAEVGHVNLMNR